jgi:hypothetical protein
VVYSIPCECGNVYIRQVDPLKQGVRSMLGTYVYISQTSPQWKNTTIQLSHQIKFQKTKVPAKTSGCMGQVVKDTIEIRLYPSNINREEPFRLCKTWSPAIRLLRLSDTLALATSKITSTGKDMSKNGK